jgi:crossover junction endodeoxyribonuclease RuvC
MRVLGIDPGLCFTGYAVLDIVGTHIQLVTGGCITTKPSEKRFKKIYESLNNIIQGYKPEIAIIENTYVNINPRTSLSLGQARGVCVLSVEVNELEYIEVSTTVVRRNLLGKGNAKKEEVQVFIETLFQHKMTNHITDAIASILSVFSDRFNTPITSLTISV